MPKSKKKTSPQILAENLNRLMATSKGLRTQKQVEKASGVAQTSVSLMLRPQARLPTKSGKAPSPKLSEVENIAAAFGMEAWQLLIDPATLSETVTRALTSQAVTDERLHENGIVKAR